MNEWMKVMLEELERKRAEREAAREEQARREQSPENGDEAPGADDTAQGR